MIVKRDIAVEKMVANLACYAISEFYADGKKWVMYRTGNYCVLSVIAENRSSCYRIGNRTEHDQLMFTVYYLLRRCNVLKNYYCFLDELDYAYWHNLPL